MKYGLSLVAPKAIHGRFLFLKTANRMRVYLKIGDNQRAVII